MPDPPLLVQGMAGELVTPDWPPLTLDEVAVLLRRYPWVGEPAQIAWRSPRPMSAAGVVRTGTTAVMVKRHHASVRDRAALAEEHRFALHLRARGVSVPEPLADRTGATAVASGPWVYEVQAVAAGEDRYRDVPSWLPFASPDDARAAGAALARLHQAASDHPAPARPWRVLLTSSGIASARDPLRAIDRLVSRRPGLALGLRGRAWERDLTAVLGPHLARAAPHLARLGSGWGHGDWHPSNLTWSGAGESTRVEAVFDLGCANRSSAAHDLAMAIERSIVGWLDLGTSGRAPVDHAALDALLDGYGAVRPLSAVERAALPDLLPVVHLEYALSELEYFAAVVHSSDGADLAYHGYLLGHADWFCHPEGTALLDHLLDRA